MKVVSVLTIVLFFCGCASDIANRYYAKERFAARPAAEVAVLYERPARDFIVIADFQSRGETPEKLRKKAAAIGADAVIVATLGGQYRIADQWAGEDSRKHTYTRITGTAIRYK
jgi:hypothetical protein